MFRGFTSASAPRGRTAFDFTWLFRQPMRAVFDRGANTLAFPELLPGIVAGSPIARDLDRVVAERQSRSIAAHKRIDRRRLVPRSGTRRGTWSLAIAIRGGNHALGARTALAVVHDVFLMLQERYPEYLVARFGMSDE